MKLLKQLLTGDISSIQDVQSYSPEHNITTSMKKHHYIMKVLDRFTPSDIPGIEDIEFYSPEYSITTSKYNNDENQET